MSTITKSAFSALRWNYLGFFLRSGSNFLIGIFLARLLGPKPLGQLAAATFVVGIANLIADAGFTSALIQAPALDALQIRFVFTAQFLIAIAMTVLCAALAGPAALFVHDPAVREVIQSISPLFILQAFGQTANALLRRDLQFRTLQTIQLISYFVGYLLIGIPMAYFGYGVWSLVVAQLVQSAFYAALVYGHVRHPVRPGLHVSGAGLLRFGAKTTASNIVNYGVSNVDNFVVGRVFGVPDLGLYNQAFRLASAPTDGIVGTVQQVLFASASRAQGRMQSIRRAYLACLSGVGFIVLPTFWALAVCAPTAILGIYGERWRPAAILFRPLVLALSLHALMAMAGPVLSSLNLVQREVQAQTITLVVAVIVFVTSSRISLVAVCWGALGVYAFRFLIMTRPALMALELRWRDVSRNLAGPSLLALLISSIVGVADWTLIDHHFSAALSLVILLLIGVVSTLGILLIASRLLFSRELQEMLQKGLRETSPRVLRLLFRRDALLEPK